MPNYKIPHSNILSLIREGWSKVFTNGSTKARVHVPAVISDIYKGMGSRSCWKNMCTIVGIRYGSAGWLKYRS